MSDIELVVKIDEEDYKKVLESNNRNYEWNDMCSCYEAVFKGTPLPKGHGKIGDLTKLYNKIDARNKGKNKGKYTGILALVGFADTIIEADKEERK